MKKLLVFDIDGTLCDANAPVIPELAETLRRLSQQHQVVLASGKPFGYIAGFVRQLGLKDVIIIGENGATLAYGATFPPKHYHDVMCSERVRHDLQGIETYYRNHFGDTVWFQPNDVNVTVFPMEADQIDQIHAAAQPFENDDVHVYYHSDSVDFTPRGVDKGIALDHVVETLRFTAEDLYVFGDGSNDLPMLKRTTHAFLVHDTLKGLEPEESFEDYGALARFLDEQFRR